MNNHRFLRNSLIVVAVLTVVSWYYHTLVRSRPAKDILTGPVYAKSGIPNVLAFGMPREHVEALLGKPTIVGHDERDESSAPGKDYFQSLNVWVAYNSQNQVCELDFHIEELWQNLGVHQAICLVVGNKPYVIGGHTTQEAFRSAMAKGGQINLIRTDGSNLIVMNSVNLSFSPGTHQLTSLMMSMP